MSVSRMASRGGVNQDGYRRMWVHVPDGRRQLVFEHVLVWERAHGPVLAGCHVHHVNRDRLDNRLENLQCLTMLEHKRTHSGCYRFGGRWWKRCKRCRWYRRIDVDFYVYVRHGGAMGYCKRCCSELAVGQKKQRRSLRRHNKTLLVGVLTENTPALAEVSSGGGWK
jgi:hypothetical protein